MKKILAISSLLLTIALPASAAEFKFAHEKNDTTVNVPASETHTNLYAVGANVDVNGNTLGDLFASGGVVTVNGNVEKDLFVFGGNLNINSTVGDNLRVAGGNISINGPITADLLVGGGNITVSEKAVVNGDLVVAGGSFTLDSQVKGKSFIRAGSVTINGKIDGDLNVQASKSLTFGPNSVVTGKITYEGPTEAVIADGAKIGTIDYTKTKASSGAGHAVAVLFTLATLLKLIGLMVAGFALIYFIPGKIESALSYVKEGIWKNLGIGFIAVIIPPIVAAILFVTVIGLYLGMIVLCLWLLIMILASVIMLSYVGEMVYHWYKKDANINLWRDLIIGTIITIVVSLVPVIGSIAVGIVFLIVLGGLTTHFWRHTIRQN